MYRRTGPAAKSSPDRIEQRPRTHNPDVLERTQLTKVRISADHDSRIGSERAFEHPIVGFVLLDGGNSHFWPDHFRKFGYRCQYLACESRRPPELSSQHLNYFVQNGLGYEQLDPPSTCQFEYLVRYSTEIEGGNVDVRVGDDAEQSALGSMLGHQPLDV